MNNSLASGLRRWSRHDGYLLGDVNGGKRNPNQYVVGTVTAINQMVQWYWAGVARVVLRAMKWRLGKVLCFVAFANMHWQCGSRFWTGSCFLAPHHMSQAAGTNSACQRN